MSLFNRKRQKDEADLIYEQAKRHAYAREVKKIAAVKGYKIGKQMADARFNQPQVQGSFMGDLVDGVNKHRAFLENIANTDWVGVKPENMPVFKKRKPND